MAISATTVFEVRSTGNDNNAGAFNPGGASPGTDWSQQDAAQIAIDGATITAVVHTTTTQLNITGATVSSAWNRNYVRITGGTATAGLYEITGIDVPNNRITLDRSAGTAAQTATGAIGGALATPGQAAVLATVSTNKIWVKAATYVLTTNVAGPGGPVLFASTGVLMVGYGATRGDFGTRPVLDAGAQTAITLFSATGGSGSGQFMHLTADGNSNATVIGFGTSNSRNRITSCYAIDCPTGFSSSVAVHTFCKAENCTTGFTGCSCDLCEAEGCTTGFTGSGIFWVNCLAYDGTTGFLTTNINVHISRCTSKGNSSHGFSFASSISQSVDNCLATNNGGWGFNIAAVGQVWLVNCAGLSNSLGNVTTSVWENTGFITLTADPYIDASNDDYRPNTTAGGGAALRAAGIGFQGQTNNVDVGAVQHSDPAAAGGGAFPIVRRIPHY